MNLEHNTINLHDSFQTIAVAKNSESKEAMIVCKNLKDPEQYWIIPYNQFPKALKYLKNKTHPNRNYSSLMGKYRHFKNKKYETLCVAINTETDEEMMVYRGLYGNYEIWARPLSMFLGYKEENGKQIKRFKKIE